MEVKQQKKGQDLKVIITGRIDTLTATELEKAVQVEDADNVIFDMAKVDYISSAGLRVLLEFLKIININHGEMKIIHLQPDVKKIFEEVSFDKIMNLG